MILRLVSVFVLFALKSAAQTTPHPSIWYDEYTVRMHFTNALTNIMGSRDNSVIWDKKRGSYKSAIQDQLTYLPFAGKTIPVKMTEVDYRDEYQLNKWELFSPERMDSIFQKGKKIGESILKYDSLGRLVSSESKSSSKLNDRLKSEYLFNYLESDSGSVINMELWYRRFQLFARYQSSYAGNFMYRPLRIRSVSKSENQFNKRGLIVKNISSYASKLNQRDGSAPYLAIYDFNWDEKGRLLREKFESIYEKKEKEIIQSTTTKDFSLKRDSVLFPLLQTPSIAKWIKTNFDEKDLNLIYYVGGFKGSSGTFLVHKHHEKLLYIDTLENPRQVLYQTIEDSNAIYRGVFRIDKQPNINDKFSYNPNHKTHLIETRISSCSITKIHSRPPGLIDVRKADGYKRTTMQLNGGWTKITYRRGSSSGQTRFAVGYPAFVRYDVVQDKYLILDPEGVVRYVGSYRKLSKVN